jgi:uncharacterized protein (TIGR04222 family)
MNDEQAILYARIESFPIDDPDAAFPFTERLARENGWPLSHAEQVVEEYRKFAFLAVAAGHPVTPSDAVDQAWHLHLTYSRSYWEGFCPHALGMPLHHHPTRGGPDETERFLRDYSRTLESYRRLFGEDPPPDVWSKPGERFGDDARYRRVNTARDWVIPKLSTAALLFGVAGIVLGVALLYVGGEVAKHLKPEAVHGVLDMPGKTFLAYFASVLGAAVLLAVCIRRGFRQAPGGPPREAESLSPYETAHLAGGEEAVFCAALATLASRGEVAVDGPSHTLGRLHGGALAASLDPAERNVLKALDPVKPLPLDRVRKRFVVPSAIPARLKELGLIVPDGQALLGRVVPGSLLLPVLVLGCVKIAVGLSQGNPVGGHEAQEHQAAGVTAALYGVVVR